MAVLAQTAGLNLVWEAATSVPPNYLGKAQITAGSAVTVTALPFGPAQSGRALTPADFNYRWTKDGLPLNDSSGLGKNQLTYAADAAGRGNTIELSAESPANRLSFKQKLVLPVGQPLVLLYEYDPLWGALYHRTLPPEYFLNKKEISVIAAPYFFNQNAAATNRLSFNWRLNDENLVVDAAEPDLVTFIRPAGDTQTEYAVTLNVKNLLNSLQNATTDWRINLN